MPCNTILAGSRITPGVEVKNNILPTPGSSNVIGLCFYDKKNKGQFNKILSQRLGEKPPVTSSESHSKSESQAASQSASRWPVKPPSHKLTCSPTGHNSDRILLKPLRPLQPASQNNTSTFRKPLPSLSYTKRIQTAICNYNKQLCTVI